MIRPPPLLRCPQAGPPPPKPRGPSADAVPQSAPEAAGAHLAPQLQGKDDRSSCEGARGPAKPANSLEKLNTVLQQMQDWAQDQAEAADAALAAARAARVEAEAAAEAAAEVNGVEGDIFSRVGGWATGQGLCSAALPLLGGPAGSSAQPGRPGA